MKKKLPIGIVITIIGILIASGFAAMSTNIDIPNWVWILCFVLAGVLTFTLIALLVLPYINFLKRISFKKRGHKMTVIIIGICLIIIGIITVVFLWNSEIIRITSPELQITPTGIQDNNPVYTSMTLSLLNDSKYTAKNITVDIKFGNSSWKNALSKAVTENQLSSFPDISQQEQDSILNAFNYPLLGELKTGVKDTIIIDDMNRDWILNQKMFLGTTPINPSESVWYQESQGWKEQIDNTESGQPINVSFDIGWKNEIGKTYEQTIEYRLVCTKIGTATSYKFIINQ